MKKIHLILFNSYAVHFSFGTFEEKFCEAVIVTNLVSDFYPMSKVFFLSKSSDVISLF